MTRIAATFILAILLGLGLQPSRAQAQLARTFVSAAGGNDANDCNRLTPCRTFQVAHDKTLANGEITVLDPGGYGAVFITKAISIINDGVGEAGVLVSGGAVGIVVAAAAGNTVSLRGLTIKGIGFGGGNGIHFASGKSLTVENCVVRNLNGSGFGIVFQPNGPSSLAVSNTFVADNSSSGIVVQPVGAGTVTASFSRVEVYNSGSVGIWLIGDFNTGAVKGTAADSIVSNNSANGFLVSSTSAPTSLQVVRSVAANNGGGVSAQGSANAILRLRQSTITGNGASWFVTGGGIVRSYGDNNIDGNGDLDPAPPTIPRK